MARLNAWRVLVFAVVCIPSVIGVWAAYNAGRSALSVLGGILVGFVAALMLGALVSIIGMFLFKTVPPAPGAPAGRPHSEGDSARKTPLRIEKRPRGRQVPGGV
jgi:hypothetical protein